ncbi:MAG: FAD-dependent oxidoreductase [Ralstonia sp.]|uniref:NADH dehydrogenase-like protein YjlD n=2 Tax=Ralstonia TaxID=48736 RepID=A0ABN9J068_9RALS|nr:MULTISPECIES: FAD-dependent oxidoreductase [Ralstonia]MBA9845292.1 pyridine nucleotide-disulfide oxidoreductase [Ralstonia pickettii]MBA9852316.1 pyridine nucleotide-disulfide oxidoreductase [Ralstonia pickettii]MBA9878712.1 pyridine nucleotide-disulfide oxidoreductase [Ralstonia pickettii]MBA9881945.1 pyridine nucleotide-disulfide oxidoreductase [Ralstonia pickettii]MBA9888788.1 pyridine nucleotide-disulfide oxidoreductase [Ralstonia pickettii]
MKRLVLLGGGHAHVHVLTELRKKPIAGWEVHLISPYPRQIYSGMLPGWIAGHYDIEQCAVRLDALTAAAGIPFHRTSGIEIDLRRNVIACEDGSQEPFDALSIDTGPQTSLDGIVGATRNVIPIRPIEAFVAALPELASRIASHHGPFDLAVVGAGAAGVELAFAIQRRAISEGWSHLRLSLIGSSSLPLDGVSRVARLRAVRLLHRLGVGWIGGRRVTAAFKDNLTFESGPPLKVDACLAVTGASAPAWAVQSGLSTDAAGFIAVEPTLQSTSHPNVFAAGDVAAYHSARPKAGVYAVRAGPVLASNLRAFCEGRTLVDWEPQERALYLVSTGGRHAIASWGKWSWSGSWVWYWKDWIDRRFVRRFSIVGGQR